MDLLLTICYNIIIIGGAVLIVVGLIALIYVIRLFHQMSLLIGRGKEAVSKIASVGESAMAHVQQAVQIAQILKGMLSTLQKSRGRGKK